MTDTTNSQAKKSNAGTSIPSKDSQENLDDISQIDQDWRVLPPEVRKAIMYLEYRKLRHKHPHVWEF